MSLQDIDLEISETDFEDLENSGEALHAVELSAQIDDGIFEHLPYTLKHICDLFDSNVQRNVFLMSALPALGGLMPNVLSMHRDGAYAPYYFVAVVAPPSSGKGALKIAAKLLAATHRRLIDDSETDFRAWKQREKEAKSADVDFYEPEPTKKSLLISANSSASAFIEAMYRNGGYGMVFEQEIDTLANTMAQDWGNFSDVLRKAFHHEMISTNRNGKAFEMSEPKLAMLLSGTIQQYFRIVPSAENGTMSRIAPFFFSDIGGWNDQRPTTRSVELIEAAVTFGERLETLHRDLSRRKEEDGNPRPLWVTLTDSQWDAHRDQFAALLQNTRADYSNALLDSVVKRAGVITLRIATILTVIRTHHQGNNMFSLHSAECADVDFKIALHIAMVHADHALRLSQYLPKQDIKANTIGRELQSFLKALPKEFKGSEAEKIGTAQGVSRMTVYNWLKRLKQENFIIADKGKKANYKKVQ